MRSALLGWGVRIAAAVCALFAMLAAAAKVASPVEAVELCAALVGPGIAAQVTVAVVVAAETALAVLTVLALPARRVLAASLVGLLVFTAALYLARQSLAGDVPCGCLPSVLDASIDDALRRNGFVVGVLAVLLGLDVAFGTPTVSAAASGPSTPRP